MSLFSDTEVEDRIREELYGGYPEAAKDWLREIEDEQLREKLRQVIREYEGSY